MRTRLILSVLLLLFIGMPIHAYDFMKDGIYYNIDGDEATVTYKVYGEDTYHGDIVIPFKVTYNGKSYRVTKIGWHAFYYPNYLSSLTIPSSIEYIDSKAFERERYTHFDIHISDLETWFNIDYSGWSFYDEGRLILNGKEIKDLIIPSGLTTINGYALSCCESFVSVVFPNSVKTIGSGAFWRCSNLSTIVLSNSITSIGQNAFSGCTNLTKIISEIEKPFDLSDSPFDDYTYQTAELIVPRGTRRAYIFAEGWKNFANIKEASDESGDEDLATPEQKMEYFFDTDPGYGKANRMKVSIGDNELTLNIDELSVGAHIMYVRSQDSKGRWSPTVSRSLYVQPYQGFWRLEYFFDENDPGQGKAIQLPRPKFTVGELLASLSTKGLLLGTHMLNLRGQRQDGSWSDIVSQSFLVVEHIGPTLPDVSGNLEYFFDKDPGYGLGLSVSVPSGESRIALNISELNAGTHILYMRSRDDDGRWSTTVSHPLYVCRNLDIIALEYYFDTSDPGEGLAQQVTIPRKHGGQISFSADINGLKSGLHQLNVRAKDRQGVWALVCSEPFTINNKTGIAEVKTDFAFEVKAYGGFCTITQREDCQRDDCQIEIADLSGRVVSSTLWKKSVSQIQLPLSGISQVYIIKISDKKDGRYFIRRIIMSE